MARSLREERAGLFLCPIVFRSFTSFLKYGLLLLCFICNTTNQFQRESTHLHGQLEEEATLEDEQAQAAQAYQSEPSQEAGLVMARLVAKKVISRRFSCTPAPMKSFRLRNLF